MKKVLCDLRIYAFLFLVPIFYLVYSCSRPTVVEYERKPTINTRAIYSLISEEPQRPLLESDGDYFIRWVRQRPDEDYPISMIDSTAYFSDIWVGGETNILAVNDGDTWMASILLPDGQSSQWSDITYHAVYGDEEDCFISPYPYYWKVCDTKSILVIYLRSSRCAPTGTWQMSFFKNGTEYYTGTFKTLPQLETGTVPSGPVYNQGTYPADSYNSICYTTQDPSLVYKCDGRPGEVPYTIKRKGCALISGTIILGYHGITVNAVDLDAWLVANGGYNLVGGLFFEKVAEYARKVHNVNVQYNKKLYNCTWEELENLICNYGPQVIKVYPQHYVVTGGLDETKTTFLLSDPDGGIETTLAAKYGNNYDAVRSFRGPDYYLYPSMFVILLHSPGELLITDANGNMTGVDPVIGESYDDIPNSSYGIEALYDSETGLVGPGWNELEIVQPEEGEYTLRITGTDGASTGNPSVSLKPSSWRS